MMRNVRMVLWVAIASLIVTVAIAVYALATQSCNAGKWFSTASTLSGIAAALQLEVSGFFDQIFEQYSDEEKYPSGPPSHINREITDVPDVRFAQSIRHWVLFEPRTGFWLALFGLVLSVPGTWL